MFEAEIPTSCTLTNNSVGSVWITDLRWNTVLSIFNNDCSTALLMKLLAPQMSVTSKSQWICYSGIKSFNGTTCKGYILHIQKDILCLNEIKVLCPRV
jgi:hypothetical protein